MIQSTVSEERWQGKLIKNRWDDEEVKLKSLWKSNLENLQTHLLNDLDCHFNIIGVTETRITNSSLIDFNPNITGYKFEYVPTPLSAGGVGMYVH